MINSKNKIEHIIHDNGDEAWMLSNEVAHQDDDIPAIISPPGIEIYYKKGKICRELGPKEKHPDGYELWSTKTKNGWHREDGATAIIYPNGKRKYYINGKPVSYDKFREQQINRSLVIYDEFRKQ